MICILLSPSNAPSGPVDCHLGRGHSHQDRNVHHWILVSHILVYITFICLLNFDLMVFKLLLWTTLVWKRICTFPDFFFFFWHVYMCIYINSIYTMYNLQLCTEQAYVWLHDMFWIICMSVYCILLAEHQAALLHLKRECKEEQEALEASYKQGMLLNQ